MKTIWLNKAGEVILVEWPKKVVWLGVERWECSNGVLFQKDEYNLAKEYENKLNHKQGVKQ